VTHGRPRLRCYMNLMAFDTMPGAPQGSFSERMRALRAAGFEGVQFAAPATSEQLQTCRELGLGVAASGRVNTPEEAGPLAEKFAADSYECATLHVGWGLEDDGEAGRLIESILAASAQFRFPLYIETHRATICQDMWRTVQFIQRFPEMRFNGDFSHWYTGQEMVYGGFEKKLAFIRPVLERIGFLHGRIANPGCIQVPVVDGALYVEHFRQLWTETFRAAPENHICFTPELLAPDIYYARTFDGVEESDRWEQSLILKRIAQECFACAQRS